MGNNQIDSACMQSFTQGLRIRRPLVDQTAEFGLADELPGEQSFNQTHFVSVASSLISAQHGSHLVSSSAMLLDLSVNSNKRLGFA